jgi:hypothetical protein
MRQNGEERTSVSSKRTVSTVKRVSSFFQTKVENEKK